MKQYRHIRGATLIELLVVLAIIGLLIGALATGVQRARESARRAKCQNNLHQLGLACHSFESAQGFFPSNGWGYRWIADPTRGFGPSQPGGWVFHLSSYLEANLPQVADNDPIAQLGYRTEISRTPLGVVRCPSRPGELLSLASQAANPVNATFLVFVPKTDYAICEGDFVTNTNGGPTSYADAERRNYPWTPTGNATGVSFLRSRIRAADITDGLSHTYAFGEKNVSVDGYYSSSDLGYDQSLYSGVDLDLNRWTNYPPVRDGQQANTRSFGSAHATVFAMSFCDGSVRWTSYSINSEIHRFNGNRQDGNVESKAE